MCVCVCVCVLFWSFLFYDQMCVDGVEISPCKRLTQYQVPLSMETTEQAFDEVVVEKPIHIATNEIVFGVVDAEANAIVSLT